MKKLEEKEIVTILKDSLSQKAPEGMVDRIMAHVAVLPVRRISIKPVEPNPALAVVIGLTTVTLLIVALLFKPDAWFSIPTIPWENYLNISMSAIWIAPVMMMSLTIWGYILFGKYLGVAK